MSGGHFSEIKELELLQMKQQHEANLEIIKGTAQVTAEAAKAGKLEGVTVSARRRPEVTVAQDGGRREVIGEGLEVLRTLRERMAPPTTYFLPQGSGALGHDPFGSPFGSAQGRAQARPYRRLQLEEARLDKIKGAEFEFVMRRGHVARVTVRVAGHCFEIVCPAGYPQSPPEVTIRGPQGQDVPFDFQWDANCFLSDLVREALLEQAWPQDEREMSADATANDSAAEAASPEEAVEEFVPDTPPE